MPAWLIPTLQAIAPHIGTIISAAKPVFTKKPAETPADQKTLVLQQQIAELQTAAADNATHIYELAAQMQKTVAALEEGALQVNAKLRRLLIVCIATGLLSSGALLAVLASIAQHP